MLERRQIVSLAQTLKTGVLVTLVHAEGSTYRRPGARLLIGGEGSTDSATHYAGTISGGCLESEVVRKAAWMAREGAQVERYSMLFDDTEEIPFGLGCGGVVDLLFESIAMPEAEALLWAMSASLDGRESTVVSFLPGEGRGLRRLIFAEDGSVVFASEGLGQHKIDCARELTPGRAYQGRFVERLRTPQRLFLLGAGDDARPVANMAAQLGWTVTVAEGRAQLARAERFPLAERVFSTQDAAELQMKANDAAVLMTHSYEQDRRLLAQILSAAGGPRYLGLLGSRHRSSLLVAEVATSLGRSIESCCETIFAPVGLDLGGDGPESIALAIIAEVQACCHGKLGSSRRLTPFDVEEQLALGGSSRYLQTQCAMGLVDG